ncbi:hypothetical protein PV328_003359 [Microctonus aethiopoides]|uniref:non-specific serine/threonine protein kinase n=1 Tax=Microctonus aethiopoides TaxID=144406 RepID=A0AA39F888_9HYME|nr:hypothetical protein PV328_003359 [Microctonus aethiopoides]
MSSEESFQDRQDNEFEVLKAIFADEITDLRTHKNKRKWQPMDITIKLTPQKGMSGPAEIYAQIDLHITCGEKYPEDVPSFQLNNSRGLSDKQVAVLSSELENLAEELKGEVMILEVTQHVQKFLHENNKPGYSSFYEEMISRHQEKLQCEMQEKQLKEDKERQLLQDEIHKRQEALKAELRDRRESTRLYIDTCVLSQSIPSSPSQRIRSYSRRRYASTCESSEVLLCEHNDKELIHFDNNKIKRQIRRGKCLGQSTKGSVVYSAIDVTTNEFLALTEWTLKCDTNEEMGNENETTDLQQYIKQIGSIEQELHSLHRLHHPNLVRYVDMTYLQKNDTIVIYVLQEFIVGTTCDFFLTKGIPMAPPMLRYFASEVLSALEYLHTNNIVHKDLRDTSIHIDRSKVIKIADYSLHKRLSDVYHSMNVKKIEHDFPIIQGRGGKKLDIYRFGILLLSLYNGVIVTGEKKTWESVHPPELRDFISKCLDSEEKTRWSAEKLRNHLFIRTPLKRELSPSKSLCDKEKDSDESEKSASDIPCRFPSFSGQSRIQNEFQALKWLGKGAFGDVLKVRNKLDGGIYAIKRIALNPKNKGLNKKITREVKLLSRLNHENVVRYYNSWIESAILEESTHHSSLTPDATPTGDTDTIDDVDEVQSENIERLTSSSRNIEWIVSYDARANVADCGEESSDNASDSDSDEEWGIVTRTANDTDSSDGIEFREADESEDSQSDSCITFEKSDGTTEESGITSEKSEGTTEKKNAGTETQFLYIQMEFCEKSTLRTAIDNGLYQDGERVWRLFREMLEGIAHIHHQGMIHRDLKPVNIFLDSNDHVKIGDFGLATTNILGSGTQTLDTDRETQMTDKTASEWGSMTGQVGTALYAAPELTSTAAKSIYNQKVDIYSLGIMLFEMWYKPLTTGMERVKVLMDIRTEDITLPTDISEVAMPNQVVDLLRWLLNHDPSQRPTAQELLASEYLPPLELEEAELQELARYTLADSQNKAYKYMMSRFFAQEVTPAEDITYDMKLSSSDVTSSSSVSDQCLYEYVKSSLVKIFRRHGGVTCAVPLLMPKLEQLYDCTAPTVKLLTQSGNVVYIPHDLRAPFARYVVYNNIPHLRRYAIKRVYREKKIHGFHPRELYECAFDIISPIKNTTAEAELIYIAWEALNDIPELRQQSFSVRINHTSLLQAVLMYCDIEEEKYEYIYMILRDARSRKLSKYQIRTHLTSLGLTDQAMETLFNLLDTESSVSKITSVLKTITKRKDNAAILANAGLREIEIVTTYVENLGVKWPVILVPLLVHNIQQHNGIIFHITCEVKRRRSGCQDVIAAGGRYDKMLMYFRQLVQHTGSSGMDIKQYGAGISISLDKLVSILHESEMELSLEKNLTKFRFDVAVGCVDGSPKRDDELMSVLRELWAIGLHVTVLDFSTTVEILDYARENSVSQVITLKTDEKGYVRLQSWVGDRFQERKISISEITDHLQRQTENRLPILNRSESKTIANVETPMSSTNLVNININFVLSEKEKMSGNLRKISKNSILSHISSLLQRILYKVPIEVFATTLDNAVIKTMVSLLDIDDKQEDFERKIQEVIVKHLRHREYIELFSNEISKVRNEKQRPIYVFFNVTNSYYKVLL